MSYIGASPIVGNFQVCDAISVVNGQAAYTMQVGSVNVFPETANHMLVSLNGILQKPNGSFTISGSTITFSSNLVTGDVIDFIQILGDVLDLGVPSDATVSTAKIVDGAVTSAKLASGVGGKVLQVVSVTKSDTFQASLSGGSFADITGLAASITPAATSSKILVTCSINYGNFGSSTFPSVFRLYRASTLINTGTAAGNRLAASTAPMQQGQNADKNRGMHATINYLDSPSSTSSVTYKINGGMLQGAGTLMVNTSGTSFDVDQTYIARTTSTITLMEVSA